jgi:hypothetical protein
MVVVLVLVLLLKHGVVVMQSLTADSEHTEDGVLVQLNVVLEHKRDHEFASIPTLVAHHARDLRLSQGRAV